MESKEEKRYILKSKDCQKQFQTSYEIMHDFCRGCNALIGST